MKMKVNSLIFLMLVQSILVLALGNTTPEMNLEANLHRLVTTAHSHLKSHIASALAGSRESAAGGQVMGSRKVAAGSSSKSDHLSSGPSATRAHIKGAQDPDTGETVSNNPLTLADGSQMDVAPRGSSEDWQTATNNKSVPVSAHDSNPSATMANAGLVIPHAAQLLVNPTSMGQAEAASRGYISCPGPFCPHNTVAPGKDENSCTTIYSEYVHCMRKYGKAARAGKCKVLTEKHAKCKEAGGVQSNLGAPGGGMMGAVAGAGTQVPGQKIPGSVGSLVEPVQGSSSAIPSGLCPGPFCPASPPPAPPPPPEASTVELMQNCAELEQIYMTCMGGKGGKELRRTVCRRKFEAHAQCKALIPVLVPKPKIPSKTDRNEANGVLAAAMSAGLVIPGHSHLVNHL